MIRSMAPAGSSISSCALQFPLILPAQPLEEQSASRRGRHSCNITIPWPSSRTGAYCTARKNWDRVHRSHLGSGGRVPPSALASRKKYERRVVKSVDGSSVQLTSTPAKQAGYPQPRGQKPGCGFPAMGIIGLLEHYHGGWEKFATSTGIARDAKVAHEVLDRSGEGDMACAERVFCTCELTRRLLGQHEPK